MKRKMTIRAISFVLAALMLLGCVGTITAGAEETNWKLSEDTEIFWVKTSDSEEAFEELSKQVQLFAGALVSKELMEEVLPISYGDQTKAGKADILLVLDKNANIARQGYEISVSGGNVTVTASDVDGLFYGCNSLIRQLLVSGCVVNTASAPDVAERALMLDIGRKYYTVDWIKEMIRELAWADMNALVLHFSEEMGLGIESKLYPWLNGRDGTLCVPQAIASDNRYLTQDEIKEIVEYAELYHVEIIPSFDSPGHMNYIVKKFNEQCATKPYSFTYQGVTYTKAAGKEIGNYYHYNNQTAIVQGSRNTAYSRGIDISDDVAVAFTKSLIEEYADLFYGLGCTKFDIGGDELLGWGASLASVAKWKQLDHWKAYAQNRSGSSKAVAYDGFLYYMNDLYDLVSGMGYTSVRMWNDDALRSSDTGWSKVVELNKNIEILFWTADANNNTNTVGTYLDAGHNVYNFWDTYNYYALGTTSYPGVDPQTIYENWNPYVFSTSETRAVGSGAVKGSAYCIWADNPAAVTEEGVMEKALPMIRANGAKAWDADTAVSYATYAANKAKTGSAPEATAGAEIWVMPDFADLELAIAEYESLNAAQYTEESYDACTAAANAAKALLAGKPTQAEVDAAEIALVEALADLERDLNIGQLVAAIARYELVNGEIYTEESFARYTAAVEAGEKLLEENPTQEDVDAAVAAIEAAFAALERAGVDTSELEAAIKEYEETDLSRYTKASADLYTEAVDAGRKLLKGTPKQEEVNAALKLILKRRDELVERESEMKTKWYISGKFKSSTVCTPKVAIVQISVKKGCDIARFAIESDLGEVQIASQNCNTSKTDRDNWTLKFYPKEEDIGKRTYTIYAVAADGTRYEYALTLKLEVQ